MAEGGEMRGFVFSLVFIIVFATLISSIPIGLQGVGVDTGTVIPIDPTLVTGFADSEGFNRSDFTDAGAVYHYEYNLGGRDWVCATDDIVVLLFAKVLFLGVFWFGQVDVCKFTSPTGEDRGDELSLANIQEDAENGAVRYSLQFQTSGDSAGSFVVYWNVTEHATIQDAWTAEEAYLLHGVGIENTATSNIGALIVSLLMFSLPEVPTLINVFIAVPVWACIIYVIWYIIKEMIPFV